MNSTSVGQNRCSEVDPTDRPFVVEWDATDTAMFESFAQRDVMFVRYQACELELLTGCTDDGLAGRYGAYNPPAWTTGSVEGFDVKDEYDLYAKLPLGASSFAAKVAAGATLSLKYFVSGMVTATRSAIGKQDLAENPRCAEATHFVQAFNLGAFELNATEGNEQRLEGKHAGVGAGGGHARSEARLKQGGDLDSCTADDAKELSRCKVPIRLVLRPLEEGATTALSAPTSDGKAPTGVDGDPATAQQWAALFQSASTKSGSGDGAGCLEDLDAARKLDGRTEKLYPNVRAQCEMLSGKCDQGMKRYRDFLRKDSQRSSETASREDLEVMNMAVTHCKGGAAPPVVRAMQLRNKVEEATRKPDKATCAATGLQLLPLVSKIPARDKFEAGNKVNAAAALKTAALCADEVKRCGDAKKLLAGYVRLSFDKKDHAALITSETKRLSQCAG